MSRIIDPRQIPDSDRCPTDWSTLYPCELREFWPAGEYLTICDNEHWRDGESLWYGTMPNGCLESSVIGSVFDRIDPFFRLGYHQTLPVDYDAPFMTDELPHVSIENISKLVWLCEEFLDNDLKFDNPLCAHYDPRHMDNIIHPGGMRKALLKLYCLDDHPVPTYYFNTGGFYDPDTMSDLSIISEAEAVNMHFGNRPDYKARVRGSLVADHGTMIPHLMVGSENILSRQDEFLKRILTNLHDPDFKMFVNIDWPYHQASYLDFLSTDPINSKIKVEFRDIKFNVPSIKRVMTLAIIHGCLLRPYEDHTIKIIIED